MRSPFQIGGDVTPPLQSDEFKETIIEQYAAQADGIGFDACIGAAVDEIWPAPEYRPHQREAVVEIIKELYVNDNSAVTLSAPTGAGKSLIIYAVVATIDNVFSRDSFITTPLNSLIDQINADEFIGDDVLTIKGMSNYQCKHRMDKGASVDNAICQRVDDFDCQYKKQPHTSGGCDYYGRKESAKHTAEVATNIAYLMANSMIPESVDGRLDPRELVLIDECIPRGETIVTSDGRRVKIEKFKSERPLSIDTDSMTLETDSLVDLKQTKTKQCVRVNATRGSFVASHDHQMKDTDGWDDASDVDRVARPLCRVSKRQKAESRAAILGYWFGDGWISSSTGVSGDVVDLERIDDDVELVYGETHTSKRSEETSGSVEPVNASRHSIDGRSNTYNYLRKLGEMLKNDGLASGDKTLQDCHIPHFDTESEKKAFIAGFFGAEGYVPSQSSDRSFGVIKASRYTVGDCTFFEEMQTELDALGVSSYIEQTEGNVRKDGTETTRYELVIESGRENLHQFLDEIGFEYCRRKEIEAEKIRCYLGEYLNKVKQWKSDYNTIIDACECRDWEYGAVKEEVESRGYGDKMKRYVSKRQKPKSITDFPAYDEWVKMYVVGDVVYENVREVENVGERVCYDIEVSKNHNFLVGDEYLAHNCQSIEDFALQFIGVVVSDNTVPVVYDDIPTPPSTDDAAEMVDWLSNDVQPLVAEKLDEYEMMVELTEQQSDNQEDLQQFSRKVSNLIEDVENNHWTVNTEDEDDGFKVEFEPIHIGRFLDSFLWSQGHKAVLSSATIPKHDFMKELGLPRGDVANVEVESTFDPHRRPIYTDCTVGKMTMAERDTTLPKMADKIADIADHHNEGNPHRGFVHCHSYAIMEKLYELLPANVRRRTRCQDEDNREQSLEDWLNADVDEDGLSKDEGGQVFLSVGMAEGISLDDWQTRWQVIAKAAHPYAGPEAKRTNYRVNELNDWDWYFGSAAIDMQQAIGRGMRSQSDFVINYILDQSAADILHEKEHLIEDYVLEAVDVTVSDEIAIQRFK
jgi:Rad3-related DNA helicase/intein/homing endonuclease